MPYRLLDCADAPNMEAQRIRDVSKLPPFFYRVQYWGAKTEHWIGQGFVASSLNLELTDDEFADAVQRLLMDRSWTDEGQPTSAELLGGENDDPPIQMFTSPLISVFSDKGDAKDWAMKQSERTGCNCLITEIDTRKLHMTGVWRMDIDLCLALGIGSEDTWVKRYVLQEACDELGPTYLIFHRLRIYPMVRMFWWGTELVHPEQHEEVEHLGEPVMCNEREIPAKFQTYDGDVLEEAISEDFEWDGPSEVQKLLRWGPDHPEVQQIILIRRYRKRQEGLRQVFEEAGVKYNQDNAGD